jgi:outer membrane protein assembly factor BamE
MAALHADQMVVMLALIEFEHRFVGFKMVTDQQSRLLKLGEHAINGGEPGVGALFLQQLVHILRRQMAHTAALEQLEYAQPRHGRLKAAGFQIFSGVQRRVYRRGFSLGYDIRNYSWWKLPAARAVYVVLMPRNFAHHALYIDKMLIKNKYLLTAMILVGAAGCKQVPMLPGIGPHKIDIQQGNAVTQEMVAKLQPGMTRSQVRFVLGTPLLVDPFRTDRWDYYYSYIKRGDLVEQRRMAVFFKDDKLDRIEGDVIAAKPAADKLGTEAPKPAAAAVKPLAAKPETATAAPAKPVPAEAPVGATLTTSDGKPVGMGDSAVAAKPVAKPVDPKPEAKAEEKPKEERGFFGRMLDKIGL